MSGWKGQKNLWNWEDTGLRSVQLIYVETVGLQEPLTEDKGSRFSHVEFREKMSLLYDQTEVSASICNLCEL